MKRRRHIVTSRGSMSALAIWRQSKRADKNRCIRNLRNSGFLKFHLAPQVGLLQRLNVSVYPNKDIMPNQPDRLQQPN
jgi:hypothetical protein